MSNLQVAGDIARNFVEEWGCQLEFSFSSKEFNHLKDRLTGQIHDPEPYICKPTKEMVS